MYIIINNILSFFFTNVEIKPIGLNATVKDEENSDIVWWIF